MFEYYVHSQNPVGKGNIEKYLSNFENYMYNEGLLEFRESVRKELDGRNEQKPV